jgi:acyl-[acyl-carrier-protein]-phospholipid O-acyltransferase/long-chain-fatty-acid--[acyl-carrier-protein] ligase
VDRLRFRTLGVELLRHARRFWRRPFLMDTPVGNLRYGEALAIAFALRERWLAPGEGAIGLLFPPGPQAALASLAALFTGRVVVHLPTSSRSAVLQAAEHAGIRWVLGPTALWHALGLDRADANEQLPAFEPLDLEAADLERDRRWRWRLWLAARWLPFPLAARALLDGERRGVDRPAVVLFTRGTTGAHKPVVLSHWNALSNLIAARQVFDVGREDTLLCCAPFWHGLGFLAGLCLPVLAGARVAHHADARDAQGVARTARRVRATLLLATPAELSLYARLVEPEAFASLESVVTGGSRLAAGVRERFAQRFSVELLEAYGCAECALLVSLNVPDAPLASGAGQRGTRPGTLGHPLPGVAVQIAAPQAGAPLPPESVGRIRVRGPNVFAGYLEKSAALRPGTDAQGWYETGDIGLLDRAGFLNVLGRAERMASLEGGEVPLEILEQVLAGLLEREADPVPSFCVLSGRWNGAEQLAVVYRHDAFDPSDALRRLRESAIPESWLPRREHFVPVPALPLHETGYADLARAEAIARAALSKP